MVYGSHMTTTHTTTAAMISAAMQTVDRSAKWTAERSGFSYATFMRKLNGGGDFTVSEVARIARALSIHPADLLPSMFHQAVAA